MPSIGKHIQKLRQRTNSTLRKVAAFLDIDQTLLKKIERGQRNATKDQVIKLASYFDADEKDMLTTYLSYQISQIDRARGSAKRFENISHELSQLNNSRIQVQIYEPSSPLDAYIENIIYYRGNNKVHPYERVFPDGAVQLVIDLGENGRTLIPRDDISPHLSLNEAWLEGIQKQHSTYQLGYEETTLAIRFTTGGFYALTNTPATEIQNSFIDAELIFGSSISSMRERLLSYTDIGTIFQAVERYFRDEIPALNREPSIIQYIVKNIDTPLSELVKKTGYSHRHVVRLFKNHVGVSPKYFQRILRFNRTLNDILSTTQKVDWADIVFDNGYYDQPHFIKEFNHFAGINPGAYLETGSTCSKFLHLNQAR